MLVVVNVSTSSVYMFVMQFRFFFCQRKWIHYHLSLVTVHLSASAECSHWAVLWLVKHIENVFWLFWPMDVYHLCINTYIFFSVCLQCGRSYFKSSWMPYCCPSNQFVESSTIFLGKVIFSLFLDQLVRKNTKFSGTQVLLKKFLWDSSVFLQWHKGFMCPKFGSFFFFLLLHNSVS